MREKEGERSREADRDNYKEQKNIQPYIERARDLENEP